MEHHFGLSASQIRTYLTDNAKVHRSLARKLGNDELSKTLHTVKAAFCRKSRVC